MNRIRISRRSALVRALAVLAAPAGAQASAYPNRPVRLVVPTPPGGGADALARVIGNRLSGQMSQPFVVDNRPGAAGVTAGDLVAHMPSDGYSLLIGAISFLAVAPSLYKSLPYDPIKDFTPLSRGVLLSNVLVVHPSLPVNNVRELIALAKAKPGAINFCSAGNATAGHLAGELFARMTGTKLVHVPYRGGGPAMADLVAGMVQISFASPPSALPLIRAGKLRALAVTTEQRLSTMPDLPTVAEAGVPGFVANNWYCFVGPAGMPSDIVARLNHELHVALRDPTVLTTLGNEGMTVDPSSPEELTRFMRAEIAKWAEVVRAGNITPG